MKLNHKWGYGQLFGFSALEGPNRYYEDNILMTMKRKLEFRFEYFPHWIKMSFLGLNNIHMKYVMSDFVVASSKEGRFTLAFKDNDTLVGVSPVLPTFKGEKQLIVKQDMNVTVYNLGKHYLGLVHRKNKEGLFEFVIHHSFASTEARAGANFALKEFDVDSLLEKKLDYYKQMPKCLDSKYESLYYKALSVNKVNVHSPEGKIDLMWTTPDRVPHRHMWMWDSAFHALAMATYNIPVAKEILLAMLKQTREDGFMPHMANPTDCSDVTQPCVMSTAVLKLYEDSQDLDYLRQCVPYLDKYLTYDLLNRDKNQNGLLEWKTEPDYQECKCGESGLDNSPRFDFDVEMDCIDFSTFFAMDTKSLSKIYELLGDKEKAEKWNKISQNVSNQINKLLWDEKTGGYYDRLFSGKLTGVLTPASFFPMFADIPSKEQTEKMVKLLTDKSLLWSKVPLASISQQDDRFSNDMWRGGVWANINYFIIRGLKKYGYNTLADSLRDSTLEMIDKWYKKTGCIFEFFDPKDEVSPFYCYRKGAPTKTPDYRKHVHSISDYNWSACFAILLIQGRY